MTLLIGVFCGIGIFYGVAVVFCLFAVLAGDDMGAEWERGVGDSVEAVCGREDEVES